MEVVVITSDHGGVSRLRTSHPSTSSHGRHDMSTWLPDRPCARFFVDYCCSWLV